MAHFPTDEHARRSPVLASNCVARCRTYAIRPGKPERDGPASARRFETNAARAASFAINELIARIAAADVKRQGHGGTGASAIGRVQEMIMDRTWIFLAALAAPLAVQAAACSQTDPMTQRSGSVESKDCATEARRMQNEIRNAPEGRGGRNDIPEAALHVDEALQQASSGDEAACWRELGKAQSIVP